MEDNEVGWADVVRALEQLEAHIVAVDRAAIARDRDLFDGQAVIIDWIEGDLVVSDTRMDG